MAWLAVDKDGDEYIYPEEPYRVDNEYWDLDYPNGIKLPNGTIKKIIGDRLTWKDNPIELK